MLSNFLDFHLNVSLCANQNRSIFLDHFRSIRRKSKKDVEDVKVINHYNRCVLDYEIVHYKSELIHKKHGQKNYIFNLKISEE